MKTPVRRISTLGAVATFLTELDEHITYRRKLGLRELHRLSPEEEGIVDRVTRQGVGTSVTRTICVSAVAVLAVVFGIASCSSGGASSGSTCTPGQQSACACPGGTTGIQTCNQDGKSLGPCLNCEGGGGTQDAALPEATATYCADHCDDSRCQSLVTCVGEAPSGWAGPVELALAPGTLPPCDATFPTKLFEGGDQPKADPATCSTSCYNVGGGCAPTPVDGGTFPPASWTNKALGCRANPPSNGNCGGGKACSPRPSTLFRQSLCIANLTGDVPCPSGPYTDRHVLGQSISDTRSCDPPTCRLLAGVSCQADPNPVKGSLSAASLVTVCCSS